MNESKNKIHSEYKECFHKRDRNVNNKYVCLVRSPVGNLKTLIK